MIEKDLQVKELNSNEINNKIANGVNKSLFFFIITILKCFNKIDEYWTISKTEFV